MKHRRHFVPRWAEETISWILVVTLFASQLSFPPAAEAAAPGSSTASAGSASPPAVTQTQSFQPDLFTGRATHSIPFAVPPGRKGVQPTLAASYASTGGNGWLGVGWFMDLGCIELSTADGVPAYGGTNTLMLAFNGVVSELVKLGDGTYRCREEGAFLRIRADGAGWEVADKSGTKYFFGLTGASRVEDTGRVFRWALDKVRDVNGNTMAIAYVKDQGQLYPQQILYTGHETTGLPPANRVDFVLEDRPDSVTGYRSGFELKTAKRLKQIETYARMDGAWSLASRYELAYTTSVRTARSLLASVTKVGTDGTTSLPPMRFSYSDSDIPTYETKSAPGTAGTPAWNVRVAPKNCGVDADSHGNFGFVGPSLLAPGSCGQLVPVVTSTVAAASGPISTNITLMSVTNAGYSSLLAVSGDAVCMPYESGMRLWSTYRVYDVTDRANPTHVGIYSNWYGGVPNYFSVDAIAAEGKYIYVVRGKRMTTPYRHVIDMIDVSTCAKPVKVSEWVVDFTGNQGIYDLEVANGVVYVGFSNKVHAIDFTDPNNPHQIGVASWSAWAGCDIDVEGDRLYVYTEGARLYIYSLSSGSPYPQLSSTKVEGWASVPTLVVEGAYAYVAAMTNVSSGEGCVFIINVSDPGSPQVVATCAAPGGSPLAAQGRYLYVGRGGCEAIGTTPAVPAEFEVVDVSNPAAPVRVAQSSGNELGYFRPMSLQIQDEYLYVRAVASSSVGDDRFAIYRVPWSKKEHALPATSMTVNPDGGVDIASLSDVFVHAWTYVFCDSDRTLNLTQSGNWDVASLWITDRAGLHGPYARWDLGAVPIKKGWSGLHIVGYNQHQDFTMGLASLLTSQVDIVSPEPYLEPLLTGDVDGNGISDLISYRNGTWHLWPWFHSRPPADCWTDGSGYAGCVPNTDVPGEFEVWLDRFGDKDSQPMIGDWDRDGRADPGLWQNNYWRFSEQNPRYSSCVKFYPTYRPVPPYAEEGTPIVGDFNGDGRVDLGAFDKGTWHVGIGSTNLQFTKTPSFDLYMAGGNPPLPPHDVRWTIRRASQDAQHDNYGSYPPYLQPWAGSPWTTTIAGEGTYDLGNAHATVGSNGDLWMMVEQDHVLWATIAVYVESATNIHVGHELTWDTAQFFVETPGVELKAYGLAETVLLQRGWSLLHVTVYNENQQGDVGLLPNLTEQVDLVALEKEVDLQRPAAVTGDFNGDGLTDVGAAYQGVLHVAFSSGTTFVPQGAWPIGWGTNEYFSADFNGDGRTDIASYEHKTGRIKVAFCNGQGFGPPAELPVTFSMRQATASPQVGEFNGDGIADPALFNPYTGEYEISFSQGTPPDLLTEIQNGVGGRVDIAYLASSIAEGESMSVVMPLVRSVTSHDGMGQAYTTAYTYHDGLFDSETRQFRGFRRVDARDPMGRVKVTEFHQDGYRKGRIWKTESRDAATNLWSRTENLWESASPYPETDAVFTRLIQVDNYAYEGDASFKQTRTRQTYDDYGNILTTYSDGDVSILGDEHYTTSSYAYNETDWIMNKAYLTQLYDASGSATGEARLAGQTRIYYDGSTALGEAPVKGLVTRDEKWLDRPVETWVASTATYDTYGNVASMKGPDNKAVTTTWDAVARTYVTRTVSPLGNDTLSTYDPRHGGVLSSRDVNGVTRTTTYDPFGRMRFAYVTDPDTSQTHLGAETQYDDAIFPRREVRTVYALPGQGSPTITYTFFDGMGRQIQQRAPAETPGQQVVTGNVVYDEAGRPIRAWTSILAPASGVYVPAPDGGLPPTEFFYEPGGRLTKTRFPDGTETVVTFGDWTTTATDPNGNTATIFMDAYGRTVRKDEVNGGETIVTRYEYDATDHVLRIIDHAGNVISNVYDSLGRLMESNDPDMGRTAFEYDTSGQLTTQTDARGITQRYFYDDLGRITRRSCEIPPALGLPPQGDIVYTYNMGGKLTGVSGPGCDASYQYDYMGRLVQDSKTIAGQTYTYTRTFDLRGRMLTVVYPNGDRVAYTYNAQDGVETVTLLPAAGGSKLIVASVTYNAANQVTQMVLGNGAVADYSFNPITLRLDRILTSVGANAIQDLSYAYDPVGDILAITDAVGTRTQTFQYDDLNRLIRASGDYGVFNYAYDALGNILEKEGLTMTYGEGSAGPHAVTARSDGLTMTYDAVGNMISKDTPADGIDRTFTYDADNRLIVVSNAVSDGVSVTLGAGWNLVSFPTVAANTPVTQVLNGFGTEYGQLTRVNPTNGQFSGFVNDPNHDQFSTINPGEGYWLYVTSATGMVLDLEGAGVPQGPRALAAGWRLLPGPTSTMTVSNWLGGLVRNTDYGTVRGVSSGVLVPVGEVCPGRAYFVEILRSCTWTPPPAGIPGGTLSFAYDHEGSRIQKTTSAGTHTFVGVMYEVAPDGKSTMYIQAAGKRVASKSSDGTILYYHTDHLGSVQVITDASGSVVEEVEYEPFGKISKRSGSVNAPQKFTGQRLDLETGLYFYKARYYDADLGRFITPDLVIQSVGDSQALNPYSYCRNNPVNNNDPSGHWFFVPFLWATLYGAFMGAYVSVIAALFTGQDLGMAAQNGALAGAVGGAFGYLGAVAMGPELGWQDFAVRALFDAAGDATLAAIKGDSSSQILKAAYQSLITSAANFGVGQWSGWSSQDHKAKILDNDMRRPSTREIQVFVPGIANTEKAALMDMYGRKYDFAVWNPTGSGKLGGLKDTVECAQDLLFGPGTASISTGRQLAELGAMSSSQGKQLVLVFHSQGTITGTFGMMTMSQKLPDGTEVSFRRQPMPLVGRFGAVTSHGATHSTFGGGNIHRQMGDIVTAIGNPQYWPTALFTALFDYGPWGNGIGYYHCGHSQDPPARRGW